MRTTALDHTERERALTRNQQTQTLILDLSLSCCVTLWKSFDTLASVSPLSCVQLFATPWTVAYQAHPSMGFSRREYWIGLPFPSPGDLLDPGIKPGYPALQADTPSEPPGKPMLNIL